MPRTKRRYGCGSVLRGGKEEGIVAVVDTGFDGYLTLAPALIAALGFPWHSRAHALLADESERILDLYEGAVTWEARVRRILVLAAEGAPLIGMALLRGYRLTIEVREGGLVEVRAL